MIKQSLKEWVRKRDLNRDQNISVCKSVLFCCVGSNASQTLSLWVSLRFNFMIGNPG